MVAPQINISVTDLTLYAPRSTNAIVGTVGPATRGPRNVITDFTDEGNFVGFHGRPVDRHYAGRAFIRYLKRGNQGKFVRVAGPNLASSTLTLYADDGVTPVLNLEAESPGTWAEDGFIEVAVTHNGTQTYNLQVFEDGQLTSEQYIGVTNGTIVSRVNNASSRIRVSLASGAGATFPAATINPVTGAIDRRRFTGGDDGAFAKTDSEESSTSGVAGRRFFGKMDTLNADREWVKLLDIDAALAGQTVARGSLGSPAAPGTVVIRAQTGASSWVELADDGDLSYGPGGAGVGILVGTNPSVRGFVDYRTGDYAIDILASSSTFFAGGEIQGLWTRGVSESVGAAAQGQGSYAGNLSRASLAPGWFNANKAVFTVPVEEQVGTLAAGGSTGASTDGTLKTLAGWIVPGTVVLTPAHDTDPVPAPIYDDGLGGFRTQPDGKGSPVTGSIDYRTGSWSADWSTYPGASVTTFPATGTTTLQAEYDIQIVNMGGGAVPGDADGYEVEVVHPSDDGADAAASDTDGGAQRISTPIKPGSVVLVISDVSGSEEVYYDDGQGNWLDRPRGDPRATAAAGGSIDYATGAWSITATATITAAATVTAKYTSTPAENARRYLRGTGPQFIAGTTPNAAGLDLSDPASGNSFNSPNWLDHESGAFAFSLDLVETGANTFNLKDGGTLTAVYLPADILGYGDGAKTVFTGQLSRAPYRRQDDRLVAFQARQAAAAGSGDPLVSFASIGASPDADVWAQNVAAATDPDNFLDLRDGSTSIQWTGAPLLDEAVFVAADDIVMHLTAKYPGDIGNERDDLEDGLYGILDSDPTLSGTFRFRVMFDGSEVESFGQAVDLDELVDLINDDDNGSDFVSASTTDDAGILDPDVTAEQKVGMDGAFTSADIVGAKVGNTTTGLQKFRNFEVIPVDWLMVPGQWHSGVVTALRELCELPGRRCIGICPVPETSDAFEVRDFVNGEWGSGPGLPPVPEARVPFPPETIIDSSQLCCFDTYVEYLDQFVDRRVLEPHDGDIMALVAFTDDVRAPWYPIAGGRRGRLLADSVKYSTPLEDRNLVYGQVGDRIEVVNSIVAFENAGLQLAGQRTMQRRPTSLDRINVRWTVNVIMNRLNSGAKDFQFELNDTTLWREIKAFIQRVLDPIKDDRGLQDAFVIVDETTTTANDIDSLRVRAKIFIKPARAAEFLDFDVILTPTGADFADVTAA